MRSDVSVRAIVLCGLFLLSCTDASKDVGNAAACGCRLEGSANAELVMSWSCYCAAYGAGCTRDLASQCTDRQRLEYPGCGMTVLRIAGPGGPIDDVFDVDGKLVGARLASDLVTYACPSESSMTAFRARAGQFPAAACTEVSCGTCVSSPTSCPVDGGVGQ